MHVRVNVRAPASVRRVSVRAPASVRRRPTNACECACACACACESVRASLCKSVLQLESYPVAVECWSFEKCSNLPVVVECASLIQ